MYQIVNKTEKLFLLLFGNAVAVGTLEYTKVINPKYSKHWLSTVAHTIHCVCSKILILGWNYGL